MSFVKLLNVSPQPAYGNHEKHYGYSAEIREDGVYIDIPDELITTFVSAGRCENPNDIVPIVEPVVENIVESVVEANTEVVAETIEPVIEPQTTVETNTTEQ